ncbi:MAG: hypothetical protein ACKV2Q_10905 [Planctomycetaceae bacterium]
MIRAHWNQGQVVLDQPASWADGSRLVVLEADEVESHHLGDEIVGLTEDEQADDPESIAKWIARMDAIPPLEMSPEDEAAMWEWRQRMKAYNIEAVRQQFQRGEP